MTDQPATTEQPAEATTREEARPTEPPTGTRELRDAQASNEPRQRERARAPESDDRAVKNRPSIRAEGAARAEMKPNAPLFDDASGRQLRERWMTIQTEFVDEPRDAVQKADALVAEVLKQLTDTFARERESLEGLWSRSEGDEQQDVSTEELRQAIRRYRSFFDRLLSF